MRTRRKMTNEKEKLTILNYSFFVIKDPDPFKSDPDPVESRPYPQHWASQQKYSAFDQKLVACYLAKGHFPADPEGLGSES